MVCLKVFQVVFKIKLTTLYNVIKYSQKGGDTMFAKNIKYLRGKYGMTQDDLAKRLGYRSFATISKWESGGSRPKATEMEKLAGIFHVAIDDLINIDLENPKPVPAKTEAIRINVLGSIPAGVPLEAIEDVIDFEDIPADWTTGGREYFALRVCGDSMFPKYQNGDIVIIRKQSDCDSGQDAVAYVNGHDATLKCVRKQQDGILLQPVNPAYESRFYRYDDTQNPITIAGIVVELRRTI
jgi:repressor LexA